MPIVKLVLGAVLATVGVGEEAGNRARIITGDTRRGRITRSESFCEFLGITENVLNTSFYYECLD